jgi:hypothetical protein
MAGQKSSRQYMAELVDLAYSGAGTSKRADKIFDILMNRGFDGGEIAHNIESGYEELPEKKAGGLVKRKSGGKIMQGYKAGGKV